MITFKRYIGFIAFLALLGISFNGLAQVGDSTFVQPPSDSAIIAKIENMTKDDIKKMTLEDLLQIPLEYLVKLSQKLGISVEELLNMKVTVSSKNEMTPRETPGIISVVTDEEIRKSGARDLIDVLRLVPGFSFGYDAGGVIGIGSRGVWGHEGKILMLIDGQEMNDLFYSTIPIANHYPVDNIKRIEIVRGPGSSIYGGNAELGVINIITKQGNNYTGGSVSSVNSMMNGNFGRSNVNFGVGNATEKLEYSLSGMVSQSNLSNSTLQVPYHSIDLSSGSSMAHNYHLNLNVRYKKFRLNSMYDDYQTGTFKSDFFDTTTMPHKAVPYNIVNNFKLYTIDLRYEGKLFKNISIIPRLNFKHNVPYFKTIPNNINDIYYSNQSVNQYMAGLLIKYQPASSFNLILGNENCVSEGHLLSDYQQNFKITNTPFASFYNQAYFMQAMIKTDLFNLTIGGRYDVFGWMRANKIIHYYPLYNAFSPRIGITKVFNKFHFKFLVSKAFRAPSVGIYADNPIKPETTNIQEMEFGYKLNKKMFVTCNIFNLNIDNAIIYLPYVNDSAKYFNYKQTGTMGVELEFRYKTEKMYNTLNYSYYHSGSMVFFNSPDSGQATKFAEYKKADEYISKINRNDRQLLGVPNHKITLTSSVNVSKKLTMTNTLAYVSSCRGYSIYGVPDTLGNATTNIRYDLHKINGYFLWNIFVEYHPNYEGLSIGMGVYDILNQRPGYVQPYMGWISPFPGPGREVFIRITYDFSFRKEE